MNSLSVKDLRSTGTREFRAVPTGNWIPTRNGRRKMETVGKEDIPTKNGKIEASEWYELLDRAVINEGKSELLRNIETHVKNHCAWLRTEKEVHEYALECFSDEAYLHWPDFNTLQPKDHVDHNNEKLRLRKTR